MAESLSYATEQRLFFGTQRVEQRSDFKELEVSQRARQIAGLVLKSMKGDTSARDGLKTMFDRETKNPKGVRTINDFGDLTGMHSRLKDRMPPTLVQLEYDMVDGVGMALQTRMNSLKAGQPNEVRDGLRAENYDAVDKVLGGGNAGVLEGITEAVAGEIITSSEVLYVLETLNSSLTKEGQLLRDSMEAVNTQIRDLYSNVNVPNDEVAKLNQYYAWALEKVGMTETRGAKGSVATGGVGQSKGKSTENQELVDSINDLVGALTGGRVGERTVGARQMPMMGKGVDQAQAGAFMDGQNAVETIPLPVGCSHEEVARWAYPVTDAMARGSLFWAGQGWQQVGPYLDRQLFEIFKADKSPGMEARFAEEKRFVQALMACRIQEQAILHCDGTPSSYAEMLPVPGKMADYLWKPAIVNVVEGNSKEKMGIVGEMRTYIRQLAYTPEGGKLVATSLKSIDSMNIWAEKLAGQMAKGELKYNGKGANGSKQEVTIENGGEFAKEMARLGVALFVIEDYARWSLWANKTSIEPGGLTKVPWMEAREPAADAPNRSSVWAKRVLDGTGRKGWVQIWGTDFVNSKYDTCVQHPFCQMMRPVDLYRFKSSWNEYLLGQLETSLCDLAVRKWMYDGDGKEIEDGLRKMLTPSEIGQKDFNRWNGILDAWVTGSQAEGLDNFKDWLKGAQELKALLQTRSDALDLGGEVAGDIFFVKVSAFMSMQSNDFLKTLSIALNPDSTFETKEIQAAAGDLMGSSGLGEFGQLFESIARINLHMGTKKFNQAMAMLQTGVKDPEKALKLLEVKKKAIIGKGVLDFLGSVGGGGGKRR